MPRFIRRLAAFLKADAEGKIKYRQRKRVIQPEKQPPKERPPIVPNKNRTRSLLLDTNPIMNKEAFSIPREAPPAIVAQSRTEDSLQSKRLMSPIEMDVAASPYARMLSGPIRTCLLTRASLPKDLMVRFGGAVDPESKKTYLLPNEIEHPKYAPKAPGKNFWVSCWKDAVQHTILSGKHAMITPNMEAHSMLLQQVDYLLQRRLVQELELLRDRLQTVNHRITDPLAECIIRELTSEEWDDIREKRTASLTGGQAILNFQDPPSDHDTSHLVCQTVSDNSGILPRELPLYNGNTFLSAETREQVLHLLNTLLGIEARATLRMTKKVPKGKPTPHEDTQTAYLIRSTARTIARADSVPLCIALWRIRLWNGIGWNGGLWGAWERKPTPVSSQPL
ncbi:hypothetical protein FRC17_010269 [Serendipita sp. 399]|nr:hypothetical protein FRC17_010269 [Serendipita sp. 399]